MSDQRYSHNGNGSWLKIQDGFTLKGEPHALYVSTLGERVKCFPESSMKPLRNIPQDPPKPEKFPAPAGYRHLDVCRRPLIGELFAAVPGGGVARCFSDASEWDDRYSGRRWILEKLTVDPPKPELPADWEWEYTGECVRPEVGKHEACLAERGVIAIEAMQFDIINKGAFSGRRHILRRKKREALHGHFYVDRNTIDSFKDGMRPAVYLRLPGDIDAGTIVRFTIPGDDEPMSADELWDQHKIVITGSPWATVPQLLIVTKRKHDRWHHLTRTGWHNSHRENAGQYSRLAFETMYAARVAATAAVKENK